MRPLLILLLLVGAAQHVLMINLSAGPGLSVQNGILYVLTLLLMYNFTRKGMKVELRSLQIGFLILIGYALVTWTIAAFVIAYPGYGTLRPAFQLKNGLIDHFLLFAVFFYGTRTATEALSILKVLLVVVLLGNATMVLDVYGFIDSPAVFLDEGRLEGTFGPPNQHGAFTAMILPALIAFAVTERGMWRLLWIATILTCLAAMIMGASRGALVGMILASVCGTVLMRRYLSLGRVVVWLCAAAVTGTILFAVLGEGFTEQYLDRFEKTTHVDARTATAGRSVIWRMAIERMFESPLTLVTGFGWEVYRSMPFQYAPHNHYLWLWFNLGVVGVVSAMVIYGQVVAIARRAAAVASAGLRPHLMACVFGFLGLLIALFFTEIHTPWFYIWSYVGLVMRIAANVLQDGVSSKSAAATTGRSQTIGRGESYVSRSRALRQ